jgi:GTP-binding protein
MPADGSDPLENYRVIRRELIQHDALLGERPELVAVTKAELPGAEQIRDQLAAASGRNVLLISAVTGQNLNKLVNEIASLLAAQKLGAA